MTFKQRIKFFVQGKPYLKIITLLLSAVAFAACSLAAMGFTNNTADMIARGLLNYDDFPYTEIEYNHTPNSFGNAHVLSQEVIDIFEEETDFSYLYYYDSWCEPFSGVYEENEWGNYVESEEYSLYCEENKLYDSSYYVAGTQEDFESLGFELLAGKYPEGVYEVAISEAHFELLKKYGYRDNFDDYIKKDGYYYTQLPDEIIYEKIDDYSDVIGKTIVFVAENNFSNTSSICRATIVGIINTDSAMFSEENKWERVYATPANKIYVSSKWREQLFFKDGVWNDDACQVLYAKKPTTYAEAYGLAIATLKCEKLVNEHIELYDEYVTDVANIPAPQYVRSRILNHWEVAYIKIFAIFGGALGVLSVVLQFVMSNYSLTSRRKQIGILQSLGMSRKAMLSTFLIETAILSLAIFIIALPLSLGIYWLWLYPELYDIRFKVAQIVYNGWNVLILAGLSFILPVLATFTTASIFFKRPPIDNMQKRDKKIPAPKLNAGATIKSSKS